MVSEVSKPTPRKSQRKQRRVGRWVAAGAVVVVIGAAGGGGWFYHARQAAAATASAVPTVKPTYAHVEKVVESSGTVAANLEVEIKCRASGEIVKLPFDISESVKKGDLLCQLDPTDELLRLRSAEVQVAQAKARLAQAKATLEQATLNLETTRIRNESALASATLRAANARAKADRQKELIAQQLGSQEDYESAETEAAVTLADRKAAEVAVAELKQQEIALETKRQDVELAEADLQAAQIALDQQKKQVDYTTVVAPMDGTVSSLDVQVGTIVASGINNVSGGTTIMKLADLSRIFVNATVDEADIGGVRVGQRARITVDSYPGTVFTGTVMRVAVNGVEASNVVTFEVKVEVTDPQRSLLKPLMTANVTIIEAEQSNVLTLPTTAIQRRDGKAFVKLASGELREVKLGVQGGDRVQIVEGIGENDVVQANSSEPQSRWRNESRPGGPPPPPH